MTEQEGTDVTNRVAEVGVIQNIVEVQGERQAVAAAIGTSPTKPTTAKATATSATAGPTAAWSTSGSPASHTATHDGVASNLITLIVLVLTVGCGTTSFRTKVPRFTHAQIHCYGAWTLSKIPGNHYVAWGKR